MAKYDKYKRLVISENLISEYVTTVTPGLSGGIQAMAGIGNEGVEMVTWINERISDGSIDVSLTPTVGTDLSFTRTNTTVTILSSTGTDVILPVATTTLGGIMSGTDKNSLNALVTLSGVSPGVSNLGTFTGSIIPDNTTIKNALQSLETAVTTGGLPSATNGDVLMYTGGVWVSASPIKEKQTGLTGHVVTLASTPLANTLFLLYINGVYQNDVDDYTITGSTVTIIKTLKTTDKITAIYYI